MKHLIVFIAVLSFGVVAAWAHQSPTIVASDSELGLTPPPIKGSQQFFAEGLSLLRPRCNEVGSSQLDEIQRLISDAERVRWGAAQGVDPRVADYLRWSAEKRLIDLLDELPGAIDINLNQTKVELEPATARVNPQHASLLIRIGDGSGPVEFSVKNWSLQGEAFDRATQLVVADSGTTYVLVRLEEAPENETTIRFSVRRRSEAAPATWQAVALRAPPFGRMLISTRDERGEPSHALLSIRSAVGGVLYEPSTAIDFRRQLNDVVGPPVSEPGRGYMFFLPGNKRGRFWVVPPKNDLTLPAGEYEVVAQRGPEQRPVKQRVVVREDRIAKVDLTISRWAKPADRGWWSGDDHVHARLMSGADADRLLAYAEAVDLHVANILEMGDPLRTYYAQRGYGSEYRAEKDGRWLIPGQEDPRSDLGHAIALNVDRKVRDTRRYLQNEWIAQQVHEAGGLYGHTHVGPNACFVHREMALFTPSRIVDFNSIMQAALGTELYYDFLNLGFKMTASAGADTPYGGTMGAVRVYAHTGGTIKVDPDAWFRALKAGKTFVTNGPMLEFSVNSAGPGEEIALDNTKAVRVVAKANGDAGWSSPRRIQIVVNGEIVASQESSDATCKELKIDRSLTIKEGCWIALHAVGHDGSEAHTTPVYMVDANGWHGSRNAAPALIEKQLLVLDEVEGVVANAEEIVTNRRVPMDLVSRNTASQAEAVRLQVAKARSYYEQLQRRVSMLSAPK